MASWWTAIHGHGHPVLDAAITGQLATMNHVMFGGLTHEPAARLAQLLVRDHARRDWTRCSSATPARCRSRSPSRWRCSTGAASADGDKHRLMTWRGGYHGDTFTPMSVCDPDGGMHSLWTDVLAHQVFAPQVPTEYDPAYSAAFEKQLAEHADELAAVIVEPVVQGAGGMRFHDPRYLRRPARDLRPPRRAADLRRDRHRLRPHRGAVRRRPRRRQPRHHVRRQGAHRRLHHAGRDAVHAATSRTPSATHEPGALMHGPTFMANALACAVAVASVELLLGQDWRSRVAAIEAGLRAGLAPAARAAGRGRRAGARRDRRDRDGQARRPARSRRRPRWSTASGCARSATSSTHAAVHLHARGDRADHLGDGRRRRVR